MHNAPYFEERSTFLEKTPPIFHFFYKKTPSPISFSAYGPAYISVHLCINVSSYHHQHASFVLTPLNGVIRRAKSQAAR